MISIPYVAYEGALTRLERTIKRIWILCIVLVGLLVVTNALWIWHESQFEDCSITQEADSESGDLYLNGTGEQTINGTR